MERCGKINAVNSGAASWTGIGVVAGCGAVVLIMQWPHGRNGDVTWRRELLQIIQEVRAICKTRNQLHVNSSVKRCRMVKDRMRLWKEGVRDLVMELCCALHNCRVRLNPWLPMI